MAGEGTYRDASDLLDDRIVELRAEVQQLHARLTDRLRQRLPPALAERLEQLEHAAAQIGAEEEPFRAAHLLETYREALRQATALAPHIEAALARLPERAPDLRPSLPRGLLDNHYRDDLLVELIWRVVRRVDPQAAVEAVEGGFWRAKYFRARFKASDAPFSVMAQGSIAQATHAYDPPHMTLMLGTSLAPTTPRLRLFSERQLSVRMARWLHLIGDVQTGDRVFDELFLVDGDPAHARALLGRTTREALTRLVMRQALRLEHLSLVIGDGAAVMRWISELDVEILTTAVAALAPMRRVPFAVDLLRLP